MSITLTDALRKHAKDTYGVAADATDPVIQKALGDKLATGELTPDKYKELSASATTSKVDDLLSKKLEQKLEEMVTKKLEALGANGNGTGTANGNGSSAVNGDRVSPTQFLAKASQHITDYSAVRVKEAVERYDAGSKRAIYPDKSWQGSPHYLAGRPAEHLGEPFDEMSERARAISGAWFKLSLFKTTPMEYRTPGMRPTDHDLQLINWAIENSKWTGFTAYEGTCEDTDRKDARVVHRNRMTEDQKMWVKTLLDDSVSGGIEIAPIEFDNAVVTVPVLFGELYPNVNVVTVTRGRRMKGGVLFNPTFTWGIAEGTAIEPFNTQAFVSAFDTPIYPITAAILIGLDFLEDSPTTVGDVIVKKYGEKYMEQMDLVIAVGDGVTQPLGIFNTASPTLVSADNSANGPPTVGDYEALYFAVQKQFRNEAGGRPAFVASDTSYQRSRSIAVSPTDERRVFGMDHQSYNLLNVPVKVQNSIPNTKIAFVMLNRYRAYRRLGMTVRMETAGQTLALANERLIVVRGRMGGQMELGGAVALVSNAQT
jgi:HK97 family phage major capsid protein